MVGPKHVHYKLQLTRSCRYTEAIQVFRVSTQDSIWHASALEGLATIAIIDSWSAGQGLVSRFNCSSTHLPIILWCFNSIVLLPRPRNLGLKSVKDSPKPRLYTIKPRRQIMNKFMPSSSICTPFAFYATPRSTSRSGQQKGGDLWRSRRCCIQVRSRTCHRL